MSVYKSVYVSVRLCVSHIMYQLYYVSVSVLSSHEYCRHVSFQEPVDINRKRAALPKTLLILFVY